MGNARGASSAIFISTRSRTPSRVLAVGALGAVSAVILLLILFHGGGGPAISQAAANSSREPGYRFTVGLALRDGGQVMRVHAAGSVSSRPRPVGAMTVSAAGRLQRVLLAYPYVYVAPAAASGAWVRADVRAAEEASAPDQPQFGGTDPLRTLSLLARAGSFTTVGAQLVRGVATTRYHAVIDLRRAGAAASGADAALIRRMTGRSSLPADIWVDAQGRVRRYTMNVSYCRGGRSIGESVAMDLFDYGPQPPVVLPPQGGFTQAYVGTPVSAPAAPRAC